MHARLRRAPEAPVFLRLEIGERARQVVGLIPMIEFVAQRLGDDGSDEEEGGGRTEAWRPMHS
jgi:hypothetical protein